ncbi:MAG: redoxin domain-containing protein [Fimbriimonadales bacterium]|nr:redoxin domain-containing protein [Fimbriimonadales bacterium]MDW8051144.1 redoxin domain-containing protein [Armatimonadota bacterium]
MHKRNRFWWLIPFTIGVLLWGVWSVVFSATPLKEGSKAPDFSLVGSDGKVHRLSDYRGQRVVLMFYPKSNTPGCTAQNCAIRDEYERLSKYAVVLAISVDSPETQAAFAKRHNLRHVVLADTDGKVAEAYGVRTTMGFASRTTFVIAPDGTIEKVFEKAGTSNHAAELLSYFASSQYGQQPQGQTPAAASGQPEKLEIGQRVPNFTLPNVNRREGLPERVTLYDIRDKKLIVIIFIATRCPISLDYDERIAALAREYSPKGVQFIGINSNRTEPAEEVARHAREKGFTFPVLKDEGNRVADLYRARVTPEVFVVDSNFRLRYHGRIDDSQNPQNVTQRDLKNALDALLAGKEPPVKETRAFGCTIKRVQQ